MAITNNSTANEMAATATAILQTRRWNTTAPGGRRGTATPGAFGASNPRSTAPTTTPRPSRSSTSGAIFEVLVFEGFQAGLSWLTILKKREAFRERFQGFDPEVLAGWAKLRLPTRFRRLEHCAQPLQDRGDVGQCSGEVSNCGPQVTTRRELLWSAGTSPSTWRPSRCSMLRRSHSARRRSRRYSSSARPTVGPTTVHSTMQSSAMWSTIICRVLGAGRPGD